MPVQRPLFTRHPFKFLYTTCFIAVLPIRLLGLALYYLPSATRPKRTFRQAITARIIYLWFRFATTVEYRTPKSLQPGRDKNRFVLLDPAQIEHSDSTYTGILQINPAIRPAPIAGFWYEAPPPADKIPDLVVLHFHGGAFVLGGARPSEVGWGAPDLSKRLKCPVLAPQYRLSDVRDPTRAFPAALQDAVTAYTYLLYTLKVQPENIILSGDSAGGNLALALLRYLHHTQDAESEANTQRPLPSPRAALLWAPWVDLDTPGHVTDQSRNASTDFIFGDLGNWGVRAYVPDGWDSDHALYPYISPLGREFATDVPIFIQASTAEVLYDSNCAFVDNLKERGCKVEFVEIDHAAHVTFETAPFTGFEEVQGAVMDRAVEFVKGARVSVRSS
ncbi:Alpha/Beta hydrolase protein [Aspergillus carlsbadensis]|nr:Alpha/Beta hydrolase protein [Aspergillus carlsbadensis]